MSDDKRYYHRVVSAGFDLLLTARDEDGPLSPEVVGMHAELAARSWNRRRDARHCPRHEWDTIDDTINNEAICVHCCTTLSDWREQITQEAFA